MVYNDRAQMKKVGKAFAAALIHIGRAILAKPDPSAENDPAFDMAMEGVERAVDTFIDDRTLETPQGEEPSGKRRGVHS